MPIPCGVGLLVGPGLVFVDFDDLLDKDGNAPDWAHRFISAAKGIGAFVERSCSGQGAHVFLRVPRNMEPVERNRYTRQHPTSTPVGIEIYTQERFAALTNIPIITHENPPELNDPDDGVTLLNTFIQELGAFAAPVLTPVLPPIAVSPPTPLILEHAFKAMTPTVELAFADPEAAFARWAEKRRLSSQDQSPSAWRFSLFLEACRSSQLSPAPVYELFNPTETPIHPGIPHWQEFSGHSKKPHRRYVDIQRAHALVQEEVRLLARDLGESPEPPPKDPPRPEQPMFEPNPSWAELGLVMKVNKEGVAKPLASSVNFIRILSRHPAFQDQKIERNLLDGVVMLNRRVMPDTQITRWMEPIRAILQSANDPDATKLREAVEVIADDNSYDPLLEHLNALPKFQPGDKSYLSDWLELIGAKPSKDIKKFSRRIIIGMIARALRPGVKFDYVPVFEGPQGIGKSTLIKLLATPDFYSTLFGGLHSKDAVLQLKGKWGVEISELASFKKSDNESLKAFFSTDTDVIRPPYGRATISLPRRTVMFGSTNEDQYLNDPTGARRIWPVIFEGAIDLELFAKLRPLIFSEALHAFNQGEPFHDTLEELQSEHRQAQMQERMVTPAWHQSIIDHLAILPNPRLASEEGPAVSGILTTQYIADLQGPLRLPPQIQHMSNIMLSSFLKRAGYTSLTVNYRSPDKKMRTMRGYAHPAIHALDPQQLRAFLNNFPELFMGRCPEGWGLLEGHLPGALEKLENFKPVDNPPMPD